MVRIVVFVTNTFRGISSDKLKKAKDQSEKIHTEENKTVFSIAADSEKRTGKTRLPHRNEERQI